MCGIAGTYHDDRSVEAMVDLIRHRGPDGSGVVEDGAMVHGHCRLAIQDPTPASAQPFRYRDGVLSYNGELWEPALLRDELAALGHRFETTGDTEVLAAALSEWGIAGALPRLDGAFTFAWSSPRERVLARSRFGSLSLYVLRAVGLWTGWSWASERKGFGADAGAAEAVPPATWVDLDSGETHRWYVIPDRPDADASVDAIERLIVRGVWKRLISDVPLCAFLSGGVDSSLTAAIAASFRPDLVAYTAYVWPDSPDLAAARIAADHIGIELREVQIEPPDDAAVRRAVRTVEVPNRTSIETTTIETPLAAAVKADGFSVAVSGEAADELFGGYGTLARRAGTDESWRAGRIAFLAKMGRADFHRVTKAAYTSGVEVRLPFLERDLVETVLALGVRDCPPGKGLLRAVAERWLPTSIARREKATFHGAAGLRAYFADRYPSADRHYNALMREAFGGIVRG